MEVTDINWEPSIAILNDHVPMKILEATNTNGAIERTLQYLSGAISAIRM